jgi:hypothetical protein
LYWAVSNSEKTVKETDKKERSKKKSCWIIMKAKFKYWRDLGKPRNTYHDTKDSGRSSQ